jgi:hypothetical protein
MQIRYTISTRSRKGILLVAVDISCLGSLRDIQFRTRSPMMTRRNQNGDSRVAARCAAAGTRRRRLARTALNVPDMATNLGRIDRPMAVLRSSKNDATPEISTPMWRSVLWALRMPARDRRLPHRRLFRLAGGRVALVIPNRRQELGWAVCTLGCITGSATVLSSTAARRLTPGPDEEVRSEPLVEVPPLPMMDRQASER